MMIVMLMLVMVMMIVVRMTGDKSGGTCRHAASLIPIITIPMLHIKITLMMMVVVLMLKTVDTGDDNEYR